MQRDLFLELVNIFKYGLYYFLKMSSAFFIINEFSASIFSLALN